MANDGNAVPTLEKYVCMYEGKRSKIYLEYFFGGILYPQGYKNT